jgi:hypothetical protein
MLTAHDRASQLVWVAPTSTHHRPRPRFYTCSRVPASRGPMRGSPWLPRVLDPNIHTVRLDTASDPGEYPCRSPERDTDCCLPAGQNRRHSPTKIFGAQHLQGRLHPLPLHLACASAEASTRLLPVTPQGSILGSRLTITQAGLAPARTRGLARPHCPPFLVRRSGDGRAEPGASPATDGGRRRRVMTSTSRHRSRGVSPVQALRALGQQDPPARPPEQMAHGAERRRTGDTVKRCHQMPSRGRSAPRTQCPLPTGARSPRGVC